VNQVATVLLVVMGCAAIAALSVPQVRKLQQLKDELVRTEARERHVLALKAQTKAELRALQSDPAYMELVARDRLNLYQTGERIFRIRR
jgi:cell division protein FtsB